MKKKNKEYNNNNKNNTNNNDTNIIAIIYFTWFKKPISSRLVPSLPLNFCISYTALQSNGIRIYPNNSHEHDNAPSTRSTFPILQLKNQLFSNPSPTGNNTILIIAMASRRRIGPPIWHSLILSL